MALTRERLRQDVKRRLSALQEIMRSRGIALTLMPVAGAPRMNGLLRYFVGAELWAGRAYILVSATDAEPVILYASNYEAAWGREMAVVGEIKTVETDNDPLLCLADLIRGAIAHGDRVGLVNADTHFTHGEWRFMSEILAGYETVDLTDPVLHLRLVKSPFELAAMKNLGRIMAEAMDLFGEHLRPGVCAREIGALAEWHVRANGGFRGWYKYSLDGRPFSMPPDAGRRLHREDIITFELDYSGPFGYWCELSTVFTFGPLPDDAARRLALTERAIRESAAVAVPGAPKRIIGEVSDAIFRDAGYDIVGTHTRHCHTIGTDDLDIRVPMAPDTPLQEDMVLSYHPASLPRDGYAFLISDNFAITPSGAIPLSPRGPAHRIVD